MSSGSGSTKRDAFMLAADGFLITAGTFAVMMGAAFGLDALGVAPLGEPGGSGSAFALSLISWLLQVGGFVVGPTLAWRLTGHRFTRFAVLGAVIGFPLGGAAIMVVLVPGVLFGWLGSKITSSERAGALVYLALVVVALLVVIALLDIDAFRDLPDSRRDHVALDVARLLATIAIAVFAAVEISIAVSGTGDSEVADPAVFMIAAGVLGATVVTSANLVERFFSSRADAQPPAQA